MQENIRDFLAKRGIQGLVRITNAYNAFRGAEDLVQSYGLGPLVPNTIILGDSENPDIRSDYCSMVAGFHKMGRNILILHDNDDGKIFRNRQNIDLWWGGLKGNGGLMMIVAYLLQSSRSWWGSEVTIKMMVPNEQAAADARANLNSMIKRLRTGAKTEIIVAGGRSFNQVLHESSAGSDLIMMGMAEPDENFNEYYATIQERLKGLPTTLMVLAGEEISYGDVLMQQDAYEQD